MKVAVEGCAHGELEKTYETIAFIEKQENIQVDLLLCCGDFEATRNLNDLECMTSPKHHRHIGTFHKYYSGEKVAPILTIFIGGNHEASNYMQELPYGGWVAPNIYYLGYAGCVQYKGLRIGGLSGIYKDFDYFKGHFEKPPYTSSSMRSVYHYRELEIFRLQQLSQQSIDVMMSHDWPSDVYYYGDADELVRSKPRFGHQIRDNLLGSPPLFELLKKLRPKYWFSAHLHCKFAAIIPHYDADKAAAAATETTPAKTVACETKFLGLSKCLPDEEFLQIIDMDEPKPKCTRLQYDLEWLTVLATTKHLTDVKPVSISMPRSDGDGTDSMERCDYRPTEDEKGLILNRLNGDSTIPNNFEQTAPSYCPWRESRTNHQPKPVKNPQTIEFCNRLDIDDPLQLVVLLADGEMNQGDEHRRDTRVPISKNTSGEAAMVNVKEGDIDSKGGDGGLNDENDVDDDESKTTLGVCDVGQPLNEDDIPQSKDTDVLSFGLPFEVLSIIDESQNGHELQTPISKEI